MKFEEVLPALREGRKIRQKRWRPEEFIKYDNKRGILSDEEGECTDLNVGSAMTSEDWEIVEENRRIASEI
jgi:hypothetical protein